MTTQKTAGAATNKKPTKAKNLPKSSNAANARRSTGGYVRAARPPVARGGR